MEIKFVKRSVVKSSKKRSSKFRPLFEAIEKLKPGGQAVEVSFTSDKDLNSMRTAVYQFCRQKNYSVRSKKDAVNKKIYYYRDK
ncbi:MAG: hypothetical protein ED557_05085 [Balneola sp.]|nr:MAG: hypothetical protein ED557_05085 [Balneola sp.]